MTNISIVQVNSSRSRGEIALYNTESHQLSSFSVASDKPRGTIFKKQFCDQSSWTLHIILVMLTSLFLFSFVTIVFILYIFFRKEPEIKATSVTVSLSMFLACYILLAYLPLLVSDSAASFTCDLIVWFSLAGISVPLITATLFVKMLRIYLIFFDPVSYKKKLFSDPLLFLYILILVSPSLIVLVIWSSYDPFTRHEQEFPHENYVFIYGRCQSNYTIEWLILLLSYYFILSTALMCLALKTSRIRHKHFRDTKATNAFAFLSNYIVVLALIYWYFFRLKKQDTNTLLTTHGILYAGHGGIVILCQILLFVPKVYPPLKRKIIQDCVKSK